MSFKPTEHSQVEVAPELIHQVEDAHSLWDDALHRLKKNPAAMAGLYFFIFIILFSFVGPVFTPFSAEYQELPLANTGPMATILWEQRTNAEGEVTKEDFAAFNIVVGRQQRTGGSFDADAFLARLKAGEAVTLGDRSYTLSDRKYLLGTDRNGRDLLTRIMKGGQISLMVGFLATLVSIVIGVVYGSVSGYVGGKTDAVMMRIVDILYAMPFTIFVILLMVFFGREIWLMFMAIGAVAWLTMARIVRGQVVSVKKQEFIEAAVALGQKHGKIIFRHVIPNVLGPVIVYSTLTIPSVILFESFLSFLGLGVQPPDASWGVLIKEGAESMTVYPWQLLYPAILFSLTLLAMNFLGDGLRDALDPKTTK